MLKNGRSIDVKVIDAEDPLEGFKIGHEKISETLTINCIELNNNLYLCDLPGFKDNRGIEIDISNSICIT